MIRFYLHSGSWIVITTCMHQGLEDDIFPGSGVLSIPKPMSGVLESSLHHTCSSIKNVRLCSETDQRRGGSTGVAPDAAEIQHKSPIWLFGSRKPEESGSATKPGEDALRYVWPGVRESTISATWTGFLSPTIMRKISSKGTYRSHQPMRPMCPAMEPFDNDHELEQKNSAEVLRMNTVDVMDMGEEETDTSPKILVGYPDVSSG
ncbi:Phosphoinositide phosphatase SAC1 [Raphanus sativus]|nr:Phosphoinositide phosphatase SAC1 [Raphanus sativus]